MALKKFCPHRGCTTLVDGGYCEKHQQPDHKRYDDRRGSSASRGYSARWQRYRVIFLRHNPLCVMCEAKGIIKPATDVDHKQAVNGPNDPLFWEPSNHQALCHGCHSRKTVQVDGGWGNNAKDDGWTTFER